MFVAKKLLLAHVLIAYLFCLLEIHNIILTEYLLKHGCTCISFYVLISAILKLYKYHQVKM